MTSTSLPRAINRVPGFSRERILTHPVYYSSSAIFHPGCRKNGIRLRFPGEVAAMERGIAAAPH